MSAPKPIAAAAQPPKPKDRWASPETSRAASAGDLELIRWSLALDVEERLSVLQDFVDTFWTPRHG